MLTSLVIQLKTETAAELPANLGRAAQALFLQIVAEFDPDLAEELHAAAGPRPYTVSNLVMGKRAKGTVYLPAQASGWLRFTGLTAPVSTALQAWANHPWATVTLDNHPLQVTSCTHNATEHPWAGTIGYEELAAPYLLGQGPRPSKWLTLQFVSPTTFKSEARFLPLPLPHLVFGSLLNRWQAFAPLALHPDVRRFAEAMVGLSRYKIKSRGMLYKERVQIGFVGRATFIAFNPDRYWLAVLHVLKAFAFFSGVGYQTTAGLGQVRAND